MGASGHAPWYRHEQSRAGVHRARTSSRGSPAVTVLGVGSEEGERRSVGDYMGGVHAGKYNFDSRLSGVTASTTRTR